MRHSIQVVLLSALCAAAVAAPASAQEVKLRYKFKQGEKLDYVLDQKMKMAMSIMNMDIETKINMTLDMSWNVIGVNSDGSGKLQIKVTHAKLAMDGPTGMVEVDSKQKNEPDDAIGKVLYQVIKATAALEMTGTMQQNGEMKDIKVSEEALKAMKSIPGADKLGDMFSPDSFKNMVSNLVFPAEAVGKGKTWTNKTEAKTPVGKTITDTTYTFDGSVEKGGDKLEKISMKPAVKIEPDPNAQVKVELKDSKSSGNIYFDNKAGRMVETSVNQTMQMQLNAGGLNIAQTVDTTMTVKLKK